MDKVLIIMATYNGEKYLQEQLDSIFSQTGVEVSVLIRDDASTDSTGDILTANLVRDNLEWYKGEHINVPYGYFELMQKAADYNIDYIAFADQDDVWDSNKLQVAIDEIRKFDTPALYYAGQRLVDEKLRFIENHTLNEKRTLKTRYVLSDFAGCTGVMNKSLLKEVLKYKPNYMLMHDTWVLRVCLCLGGNVVVDCNPHMSYRQHSGNTLGLGHSFGATVKQVKQYISEYRIEELTKELMKGYGSRMVPEYLELSEWICGYRANKEYRRNLLKKENVDFCNKGLNLTYRLKIALNRL